MATVKFENVEVTYAGANESAVKSFNLDINTGEFIVIVGPSGCGKSTTLRALAGLEPVSNGKIFIDNKDVTDLPPKDRDIAMVFQNYALYPHMTVEQNIGFALKIAKVNKKEIKERVNNAAEMLGLTEYLLRKPKALSGGQRQRVAMGRAIVRKPNVFLMDEPLSNLDTKLRVSTRTQIAELQSKLGVTTVYVTHDQTEAMTMGHRIVVMKDGYIQQIGTPGDQYQKPQNVFVAGFIGSPAMNIGLFNVKNNKVIISDDNTVLDIPNDIAKKIESDKVYIGIRPENLEVSNKSQKNVIPIRVSHVEYMGSDMFGYGEIENISKDAKLKSSQVIIRTPGFVPIAKGEVIYALPSNIHFFDAKTSTRIGSITR
jgi:multiple sugar transport system ATP-binding protein